MIGVRSFAEVHENEREQQLVGPGGRSARQSQAQRHSCPYDVDRQPIPNGLVSFVDDRNIGNLVDGEPYLGSQCCPCYVHSNFGVNLVSTTIYQNWQNQSNILL